MSAQLSRCGRASLDTLIRGHLRSESLLDKLGRGWWRRSRHLAIPDSLDVHVVNVFSVVGRRLLRFGVKRLRPLTCRLCVVEVAHATAVFRPDLCIQTAIKYRSTNACFCSTESTVSYIHDCCCYEHTRRHQEL